MPDAVSIRILTDEGLRLYRRSAFERFRDRCSTPGVQVVAAGQVNAATDEMKRRVKSARLRHLS